MQQRHIGVNADTGQIVAAALTTNNVDDGSQVGPLLDQMAGPVAPLAGDGAYDQGQVYSSVAARHPDATIIAPPRSTGVPAKRHPPNATAIFKSLLSTGAWRGRKRPGTTNVPASRQQSDVTNE
jgi:Transposase DDE domain